MKKIEEYIFYRTYIAYKKKNDPALFSSVMYLCAIYMALSLFICGTFANFFRSKYHSYDKWIFIIWYAFIIIRIIRKYYNQKNLNDILAQNQKKKILPTWFYFTILPISMVIGVALYGLITSYIIKKFDLEGIIYQKIIEILN
jgi:hypothetical protein